MLYIVIIILIVIVIYSYSSNTVMHIMYVKALVVRRQSVGVLLSQSAAGWPAAGGDNL